MMAWYIAGALTVFLLSFWAYVSRPAKYADLMGVSVLLMMACVVCNIIVEMYHFPDALLSAPIIDLTLAVMIYRAWARNREPWKVVMVGSLVVQLVIHMTAIFMWQTGDMTQRGLYQYAVSINAVFIVQLLTLGWVGAGHGLGVARRWLFDRRGNALVPNVGR